MPPKRKSGSTRASTQRQQSTLSFHGKSNQITKPVSAQNQKASKKDAALVEDVKSADRKEDVAQVSDKSPTVEAEIRHQEDDEAEDPLFPRGDGVKVSDVLGGLAQESEIGAVGGVGSGWVGDEEEQARKITESQINRYWRQKEQERLAPRVHQEDLTVHEKILREWDMSGQYGVSELRMKEQGGANA